MGKIKLNLESISPSMSQSGSFSVILGVDKQPKKIPIIIGEEYGSYISRFAFSNFTNSNQYVDVIKNLILALGAHFEHLEIKDVSEGIFEAYLVLSNVHGEIKIQTPIGVGLSYVILSKETGLVYASEKVVDKVAIKMDNDGYISEEDRAENHRDRATFKTSDELQVELDLAIAQEDYVRAAEIRDQLKNVS